VERGQELYYHTYKEGARGFQKSKKFKTEGEGLHKRERTCSSMVAGASVRAVGVRAVGVSRPRLGGAREEGLDTPGGGSTATSSGTSAASPFVGGSLASGGNVRHVAKGSPPLPGDASSEAPPSIRGSSKSSRMLRHIFHKSLSSACYTICKSGTFLHLPLNACLNACAPLSGGTSVAEHQK
jgi:hypothetical protein